MSFFQVGWSPIMTNNSKVLALKYRPQAFKDLVGHEEISDAIFNSIKIGKSANAFLFTGIRGIGKTTFARIVAKALNCNNGVENLCDQNFCSNCDSIINYNHIDVLEIDAASRTGVDDVRELIEFSRYRPSVSKYKVFIIDEVHMLSKQAFNALLKTLEEPPSYLKFIFATTEIKKIPITVVSRCQRYDLSRISSEKLLNYLKEICLKEKKNVEENALKLIVKISEGSVRDALSLLDRAIISNINTEITLQSAQEIFGYINKFSYIELIEFILKADEKSVIDLYRSIYNSGVDPISFLNEFLEILYYLKNISNIVIEGTNFSLNDSEYAKILKLSKEIENSTILLFWEFTLKAMKELNIVSNQNLLIEMFLIQLIFLSKKKISSLNKINNTTRNIENSEKVNLQKKDTISQIKNIKQEDEITDKKIIKKFDKIENLDDIINICIHKKELKLKYELENNVNLVSFSENRIEISFNQKLHKNFVKELSEKLFEWTNKRWIILFSNEKGNKTKKEEENLTKEKDINNLKNSDDYNILKKIIPDLEIIDIKKK